MDMEEDKRLLLGDQDDDNGDTEINHFIQNVKLEPGDVEPSNNCDIRISRRAHISNDRDLIAAIFIVAFDTKKGNVVEWIYPEEMNLEGVEFRAMASGFHTVENDFIYFKHNQLFGLGCYHKVSVDSIEERGARMKTIGLLAVSYSNLHSHMSFLKGQAQLRVNDPSTPYNTLVEYFWKAQAPRATPSTSLSLATTDLPHMEITHPNGCFKPFLEFFGPNIFALWKMALLKKRILILSPPPIGVICYRVYCTCLLASHNIDNLQLDTVINPLFFVNVADIDMLSEQTSYIACTTERIFQTKPHLYDVIIDNQTIEVTSNRLEYLLKLTQADLQRYTRLVGSNETLISLSRSRENNEDDAVYARFFQQLNTELYRTLVDVSGSSCEDHVMTCEMIETLTLDVKDRLFLTELASLHRLNVTVQRQSDVFSCCI